MPAQASVARCSDHPEADAGWRCHGCRKHLCGACTAALINLFYCAHCDELATQLSEPRDEKPFSTWVIDAVTYPVAAFLLTGLVTVPVVILSLLKDNLFGYRAAQAAVLAVAGILTIVYAARRNADGRALMFGKTLATTALLWVPVAAYVLLGKRALDDELAVLVAGLAGVYVPAAVATSATDAPIVHGLNPFAVFEWLWKIKARYAAFVISTFVLGGIAARLSTMTLQVSDEQLINDSVTTALAVMFLLMACRMLGTFVHVHGYVFGWGPPESYVDPLVPGLKATAGRKGKYGVGGEGGEAATAVGSADAEQAAAREIRRHLAKDDVDQALAQYKKRDTWSEDAFNPKGLLDLGVAAAKARDHELALALLTRVSETDGPFAPRALFRLARLHEDALGQPDRALSLYRQIVEAHPRSDVARPATQRLQELEGGQ